MATLALPPRVLERFWAKVEKTDSCWNWTASRSWGYGSFGIGRVTHKAHRVSYEIHRELIPQGLDIDHRCFNRACVNPKHLRVVTRKQNNEHRNGAYKNSKTGIRGVSWHRRMGKWQAIVNHDKQVHLCGYFTDIKDAEVAAIAKRNELFTHNDLDRKAA